MIKNFDIVIISLQSWDIEIGSNCKDIAVGLSKFNRVLYVNSPLDRLTRIRRRNHPYVKQRMEVLKDRSDDLVKVKENLWTLYPRTTLESISRLPWDWLFDRINRVNNHRFAREIQKATSRLGFRNFILFNDGNMFRGLHLKEFIRPSISVYYYRDNYLEMDFWKIQGRRIQPELMSKSDLVLVNSEYLGREARRHNSKTFVVGQGYDHLVYNRQNSAPCPVDMRDIPHPVIGYTGALLTLRLEQGILRHMAGKHPDWSIVLVGPEDESFTKSDLHRFPNIHFMGTKDPMEIPAYIRQFDVAINPQRLNAVTLGNYPRKIDEYLGMGRPVVATRTEFMMLFSHITSLADTIEEYVPLIEKALETNTPEQEAAREAFAQTHSWDNNLDDISAIMERAMEELQQ